MATTKESKSKGKGKKPRIFKRDLRGRFASVAESSRSPGNYAREAKLAIRKRRVGRDFRLKIKRG